MPGMEFTENVARYTGTFKIKPQAIIGNKRKASIPTRAQADLSLFSKEGEILMYRLYTVKPV